MKDFDEREIWDMGDDWRALRVLQVMAIATAVLGVVLLGIAFI